MGRDVVRAGSGDDFIRAGAVKEPNDGANDDVDCGGGRTTSSPRTARSSK